MRQFFQSLIWRQKKKALKRNVKKASPDEEKRLAHALQKNPYLQSRALWNDLYGSLQVKLENSYRMLLILSIVLAMAIIGLIVIAGETKIKPMPFIVHGDEVITLNGDQRGNFAALKNSLALFFLKQFIRNARSVSSDGVVNASHKIAAFSLVTDSAAALLKAYYEKEDSDTLAQTVIKTVQLTSVLRESAHTVEVRWLETSRNVNSGELIKRGHYIAQLRYQYGEPSSNAMIARHNPIGLEITHLSWSADDNTQRSD